MLLSGALFGQINPCDPGGAKFGTNDCPEKKSDVKKPKAAANDTGKATGKAADKTSDVAKTAAKDASRAAETAAKDTGTGVKKGAKAVGHGVKKGTDKAKDTPN